MNDLEWLARNVHEWPTEHTNDPAIHRRWVDDAVISIAKLPCVYSDDMKYCTHDQWLSERARLQNKPSWDDAPEWAQWLAQDGDGSWVFYESPLDFDEDLPEWVEKEGFDGHVSFVASGEVLGDWRDTLERRPKLDSYVTKAEADQYYCDREGECLMNNQHQHPSSTEWTGPEQGFPPPGTRCMVMDSGEWLETYIIGMDTDGFCVYETPWSDYDNYDSDNDPQAFYPLMLTDEDKAVEEMRRTVFDNTDKISVDDVCRSLHRDGYRITSD